MTTHVRDNTQIDHMPSHKLSGMIRRMKREQMIGALAFISGYCPDTFAAAIKRDGGICALQADADNFCILPAGHTGSHDAGEFTWDTQAELDELHTIAAK